MDSIWPLSPSPSKVTPTCVMPAADKALKTTSLLTLFASAMRVLWRCHCAKKSLVMVVLLFSGSRVQTAPLLLHPWPSPRAGGSKGRQKTRKIVCRFGAGDPKRKDLCDVLCLRARGGDPLRAIGKEERRGTRRNQRK